MYSTFTYQDQVNLLKDRCSTFLSPGKQQKKRSNFFDTIVISTV